MTHLKKTAIDLSRGKVNFYLTSMTIDELINTARVSRVNEDLENGFQRTLDETRARRISKYLQDNKIIPGALILSCQKPELLEFNPEDEKLNFPIEKGLFLVIDGQHRLYGSALAKELITNLKVPVCILSGLKKPEEIQYFIDINSNQKGVPKTLRIELTKYLVEEDSLEGTRLRLFEELNTNPNSPLHGRLSSSQKGRGFITHVPFEQALNRVLLLSPLKDLDFDKKVQLISNYLSGVKVNLIEVGQQQKIFQAVFFQAIFRVFEKACSSAMTYKGNYKSEAFEQVFEILQKLDFDLHSGTNDQAIATLERDILDLLDIDLKSKIPQQDLF